MDDSYCFGIDENVYKSWWMNQYFEHGETIMSVDGRRWMNVVEHVYEKRYYKVAF